MAGFKSDSMSTLVTIMDIQVDNRFNDMIRILDFKRKVVVYLLEHLDRLMCTRRANIFLFYAIMKDGISKTLF